MESNNAGAVRRGGASSGNAAEDKVFVEVL
jgi:hypothetical protein